MGDAIKAFLEFLVDLFAALSEFLGGKVGSFNLDGILDVFNGDDTADETFFFEQIVNNGAFASPERSCDADCNHSGCVL